MVNCLGHHRCVDDHALHARRVGHARTFGCFGRRYQQFFGTGLLGGLAPAPQIRWIDRRLSLWKRLAGEDLPIGILDPLPHDLRTRVADKAAPRAG
jgi:hypothetical protein